MKHFIIIVPGWGTVYGIGTFKQAKAIAISKLRRGLFEIREIAEPDPAIEWKPLEEYLK